VIEAVPSVEMVPSSLRNEACMLGSCCGCMRASLAAKSLIKSKAVTTAHADMSPVKGGSGVATLGRPIPGVPAQPPPANTSRPVQRPGGV